MVRKVRKNKKITIQEEIRNLRHRFGNLISVNNAEWYSLFKDEIRNSIAIEGVFANRQELLDVLEHNNRTNKQKAAAILGYFESASTMYEYAHNQFKENEFLLRMADIKQIHTLLMRYEKNLGAYMGEIGDFRKINIQVSQATFKPLDVFYLRSGMTFFINWFNETRHQKIYDEITLAAIVHVWFETIHPFRDGNGRVGRILLSYILIGQGLMNVAIKGISKKERDAYYNALELADDCFEKIHRDVEKNKKITSKAVNQIIQKKAFLPFIQMIHEALTDASRRFKKRSITNLDRQAVLPLRELAHFFDYSQDYLRNLINRGKLKAHKKGKLWYVSVQDMQEYISRFEKR